MQTAQFLYPDDLEVNKTRIGRVLIIGSCNALSFENFVRRTKADTEVELILTNHFGELPAEPPSQIRSYDFHFIQIALRSVLSDIVIDFKGFLEQAEVILQNAKIALRLQLDASLKYNKSFGVLSFVSNFPVPQRAVVSAFMDAGKSLDLKWLVQELNSELVRLVGDYQNVLMADVESVGAALGKRYFQDDVLNFYAHGNHWFPSERDYDVAEGHNAPRPGRIDPLPLLQEVYENRSDEMFEAVWRQCIAMYRIVHQVDAVKMVIFDLDDTLWRGQIAEHYGDGGNWPVLHGWPTGLWEAVHHLRARGILTALCSKNDAGLVERRWDRAVMANWLSLDHFLFKEINWQPKAKNIERMIASASLTAKSVVFVDDNPVEREAVRAALPGIRVIGSNPFVTRRILLWSAETQPLRLTQESARREAMMQGQQAREMERASTSRADFLAGLRCEVRLRVVTTTTDRHFGRSFELLNKTNQFNTTGLRWKHESVVDHFRLGGKMFVFEMEDKFSHYGLVGVILYRAGHFIQFAMSCRVLGLKVETSVVNAILRREAADGAAERFSAEVVETDANMVSRTVYGQCGFTADNEKPRLFTRSAAAIAPVADHLRMVFIEDEGLPDACPASSDAGLGDAGLPLRLEDLESRTFAFSRADGSFIGSVTLEAGGALGGYQNSNENAWRLQEDRLVFLNDRGQVSTIFENVVREGASLKLAGPFLLGGTTTHVLSR